MTTKATRNTQAKTSEGPLFMAFELSEKTGTLGFTTGPGQKPRERNVTARDQERVRDELAQAKHRLGLPETALVVSCYAAGGEGFWLHRFLAHSTQFSGNASTSSHPLAIAQAFPHVGLAAATVRKPTVRPRLC